MSFLNEFEDKKEAFQEEEYVVDPKFKEIKKKKRIITIIILVVLGIIFYSIYFTSTHVKMDSFVGKSSKELEIWAKENNIRINYVKEYSESFDKDTILKQNVEAGKRVKKGTSIIINSSEGADPDVKVKIPNFKDKTYSEIESWATDNKLSNYEISYINSDKIAKDEFISYKLSDSNENNFVRKNRITIFVSKGKAVEDKMKTVIDFSSKTKTEIIAWGKENDIKIRFTEKFSSTYALDSVISQSVEENKEIEKGESITIVLSKGEGKIVPDFSKLTPTEAESYGTENNLTVIVKNEYKVGKNKNDFISQSKSTNTKVKEGANITVVYAMGKISVESFVDNTIAALENYIDDLNSKNANITLVKEYKYDETVEKNYILYQNYKNENIDPGSRITVVISRGKKVIVDNYLGKTQAEIEESGICNELICIFNDEKTTSASYQNGDVFNQSIKSGSATIEKEMIIFSVKKV